jgi:membrane-bound acyltransferase YfiQ involved in biofilm formation
MKLARPSFIHFFQRSRAMGSDSLTNAAFVIYSIHTTIRDIGFPQINNSRIDVVKVIIFLPLLRSYP